VAWTLGGTAACALTDARLSGRLPDAGVAVSCLTLIVDLLLMRALDDIRDLDYDREHHPARPLARGEVSQRDLAMMIVAGTVFMLAINAWRWPVMCVLAAQLGYAFAVLWADRRLRWPPPDAPVPGFLVGFPVQLLINAYLYAGLLYATGRTPSWWGLAGIAVPALAFAHLEFARKTTRKARPGERTYASVFGASGTAALAVSCAVGSVVLLVSAALASHGSTACWLAVAPLAFVAAGAARFWRDHRPRWPYGLAALFMITSFAGYEVILIAARTVS
jgi:4-hydroxybenzoate polyprenyltransferase